MNLTWQGISNSSIDYIIQDKWCFIFHKEWFQLPVPFPCWNKSGVKRLNTLGHLDQYMAHRLWNSLCDDFVNYSSTVPIPHWLCILHVHWCRDCETVPEQLWNKPGTVSQSQCTPPQCTQIIFGIKHESEVQGQSSSELTGILTVLKCICGPNLEILTWKGDE